MIRRIERLIGGNRPNSPGVSYARSSRTMFGVRNEIYASCPTVMRPHARCPGHIIYICCRFARALSMIATGQEEIPKTNSKRRVFLCCVHARLSLLLE